MFIPYLIRKAIHMSALPESDAAEHLQRQEPLPEQRTGLPHMDIHGQDPPRPLLPSAGCPRANPVYDDSLAPPTGKAG